MKNSLSLITVCFIFTSSFAQENNNVPEEKKSNFTVQYNYLIRAQEEKTQIWKFTPVTNLNIGGGGSQFFFGLATFIGYEKKFSNSFSLNGEVGYHQRYFFGEGMGESRFDLSGSLGPRYYYNINRRIALGKSANNFSANYFSTTFNIATPSSDYPHSFSALYGIQRRLGDKFFIDFGAGVLVIPKQNGLTAIPDVRLRIGFGW